MCALSAKEIGYLKDHFIESVTENWRYFRFSPWTLFRLVLSSQLNQIFKEEITGGGRGGMFICSKLRHNLSEIEVSTFERIQRAIWDHLLPFKGVIIQKQALFSFQKIIIALLCCLFCFFFRSLFQPAKFIFSSKSCKDSSEKMFPFKVQFGGHNSAIF